MGRNTRPRLVFLTTLLSCSNRILRSFQQYRAQSRLFLSYYHISGDNFVASLYGSVGHFFVLKLPKNLYSFKHFSTSQVRSGQIEPKLLQRVVNQPQYSLNLAHLRSKPYDMGVYGCQSENHEVCDLSRRYFVTSARIKLFQ